MGFWRITVKDLCLIMKDRGALYTLLALPIVFIAILGASTGQLLTTHDQAKLVKIGIVNECPGSLSDDVFRNLSKVGGIKAETISDRGEAHLRLQNGRSSVVVFLGHDFESKVDEL
jgi:ABC-2 type transport system permease protein